MAITAVILGSGTSNGCPSLGYDYSPEFLANPKNWRTRSSLLLEGPEGNLLIDAAPEMRLQLLRENVKSIDAVLITHTHADHIMGMDDLRCFEQRSGRQMVIYAQPLDQEVIRRVFSYAFVDDIPGVHLPRFILRDLPEVLDVGGMSIQTFTVMHGPTPVVGIRVGGLAYLTDVSEIPPQAWAHLSGLDTLIIDAVRRRPHPNHLNFEQALDVAGRIGAGMTYFTHLSHDYDHDVTERDELPENIRLAYDGLRISV
ncbi:MAG: MBL fold metallo-hydrolase [Chthonomonas sp.]|nr:MBL fold metallo-hydrolase [Chthonomonas sp.]